MNTFSSIVHRAIVLPIMLAAPALTNFPLVNTPHTARADAAATSQLTGIKMPKGAATFNGADANFSGVLTALAKENVVKQTPAGEVEVFAWRGDSYKPNRSPFTKTALSAALSAAGYTVKEIDDQELRNVNVFEHFDSEDASLTFRPSVLKRATYFQATNEAKSQSVLGAWLEDDDALAVALLPVAFNAKPKAKPLPAVAGDNVVLVKDFTNTTKGLPAPKMPAFPKMAAKPGTVRGMAKDGAGKPLPGVEVAVHCSAGGGFRTTHKARTNAQGIYQVLLPAGIAEVVEAKANITFDGRSYGMYLAPVSGDFKQFEVRVGHVEHLVLRASGEYGGNIRVLHGISEGGTIEITVKPQGRQMDGSMGRTYVYRYPSGIATSEKYLQFLPLGRYTITARLLEDGEALPIRVARTFGPDEETQPQSSLPVVWESGMDMLSGNTGKSGIRAFQVTLKP